MTACRTNGDGIGNCRKFSSGSYHEQGTMTGRNGFKKVNKSKRFSAKDVQGKDAGVSVEQRTQTPLSASIRTKNTSYHEASNALTPHDSLSVPWRRPFRRPRSSRDVIHRRQTQILPRNCRVECAKRHWFLGEANGGYEDIFWNIQIVRTFSLNVL